MMVIEDSFNVSEESDGRYDPTTTTMESVKHQPDVKNSKSSTLGRVGRIFKIRGPTNPVEEIREPEKELDGAGAPEDEEDERRRRRKEKTHSLGRMLRLVDKDGAPRKIFSHGRTGSLNRLRKLESSTVGNVAVGRNEPRNLFARMFGQFRGKAATSSENAEPNLPTSITESSATPSKPSLGTRLMMSLSTRGNSAGAAAEPGIDSTV